MLQASAQNTMQLVQAQATILNECGQIRMKQSDSQIFVPVRRRDRASVLSIGI